MGGRKFLSLRDLWLRFRFLDNSCRFSFFDYRLLCGLYRLHGLWLLLLQRCGKLSNFFFLWTLLLTLNELWNRLLGYCSCSPRRLGVRAPSGGSRGRLSVFLFFDRGCSCSWFGWLISRSWWLGNISCRGCLPGSRFCYCISLACWYDFIQPSSLDSFIQTFLNWIVFVGSTVSNRWLQALKRFGRSRCS